ncbi:MAG: dihydroorotate dehydrogenase [Phycisphaerales bacterium]|nr:dihydroorotate dehydrogenase [Phycisphaerales bacterium]MCB9836937.1 dihydroorotate dehydrogenase [Phycisphaera sp.]
MARPIDPRLSIELAGIPLRSPVILAAGTAGYSDELADVMDLSQVGAVVCKSITREPRVGNETWRVWPAKAGMLNAIGLANPGIDKFMSDVAPRLKNTPTTVFGSIAGTSIDDYAHVARHMETIPELPAIEINVSCPNVHGGTEFGADAGALRELVSAVRAELTSSKLIVKLSPIAVGQPTLADIARAAIEAGADALTIANTVPAMQIDVRTRRPVLSNVTGGLSGPAVHPIAVKLVHDVYRKVAQEAGVPIIGLGGVSAWDDAAEFILAGATAVGVGTALFADPRAPLRINRDLSRWLNTHRVQVVKDLVGQVILPA